MSGLDRSSARRALASILFACIAPVTAARDAPVLELPVDCDPGDGCMIQNYFDHDPGPGFADHHCGALGYDGHDGIDFRLRDLDEMRSGAPVRAAAAGRVRAVRDSMPDVNLRDLDDRKDIEGREAGNSVAIRHGNGWETQYSHLRRGSVRVRPGDEVKVGQVIGEIGLSGKTEFPHLHFSVRRGREEVDPFVGAQQAFECGGDLQPLWSGKALAQLSYRPTGLIQAGLTDRRPDIRGIEHGRDRKTRLDPDSAALVFWVELYGVQAGDRQRLVIRDPRGRVVAERDDVLEKGKARWFSYVGRRRPADGWPAGVYRATFSLRRGAGQGAPVLELERAVTIAGTD